MLPTGQDASVPSDGDDPADVGVHLLATPCTRWDVESGPRVISSSPHNVGLTTLLARPDGALLSWSCDDSLCNDFGLYEGLFGFDGAPTGGTELAFSRAGGLVYWSAPSFASTAAGFAAVSWDQDDGCRFESLDAAGTPSTSPITLGQSDCYMLASSGSGLSFLTSPDIMRSTTVSLVSIDDGGNVKARTELIHTDAYVMDRTAFDDGSFALLWLSGSASYALDYQHFEPDGTPESAAVTLGKPVYGGIMARAGSGLLVGWLPASSSASGPVIEVVPIRAGWRPRGRTPRVHPRRPRPRPRLQPVGLQPGLDPRRGRSADLAGRGL